MFIGSAWGFNSRLTAKVLNRGLFDEVVFSKVGAGLRDYWSSALIVGKTRPLYRADLSEVRSHLKISDESAPYGTRSTF